MIGQASKDEKGKYSAGISGDQTKSEVYARTWYNRPWNCIVRAKDSSVRYKIAEAMEKACANDKIGYDQNQRNTLLTLARKVNYDPAKVTTPCETDCSALTSVCCMYAGISENYLYRNGNSCTTSTLRNALLASGMFEVLTDSKYRTSDKYLLRGDILLYEGHHVAVNLTDGAGTVQTESKQTNPYVEPSILLKKGMKSDSVKWLQWELVQAGFPIVIDGDFGLKTETAVKSFQKLYNLKIDGIVGSATRFMLKAK